MSDTKVSMSVEVAASDFATDSVEGQRWRPSGVMRLDLLKVVGSSPARLASPDADSPERAASRSRAFQICAWVSMACPLSPRIARTRSDSCQTGRNYNRDCNKSSTLFAYFTAMQSHEGRHKGRKAGPRDACDVLQARSLLNARQPTGSALVVA